MTLKPDFLPVVNPNPPTLSDDVWDDYRRDVNKVFMDCFNRSTQLYARTYLEHFRANGCPIRLKTQPRPSKRLADAIEP